MVDTLSDSCCDVTCQVVPNIYQTFSLARVSRNLMKAFGSVADMLDAGSETPN